MRKALALALALLVVAPPAEAAPARVLSPVLFVHGMGTSADDIGTTQFASLLKRASIRSPLPDACSDDAQPDRPWNGSPCVFRYVEDAAENDEGPNDSQSAVGENAEKLAAEIDAMSDKSPRRITLVGYSMGGAIIRTYLARHREQADRRLFRVVLLDAVASGSWGYAFATEFPRRFDGSLGTRLKEVMRSAAASSAAVDFTRPATRDLSPRSAHFRSIAQLELPRNISYFTFWGDIRVVIRRGLLAYELPDLQLPSLGDLGLLPGDPDPTVLPELGGQRFSPPVSREQRSVEIAHRARITLDGAVLRDLISACGRQPTKDGPDCADLAREHIAIPNSHTAIPVAMDTIRVDAAELGGEMSLEDAVLNAIAP